MTGANDPLRALDSLREVDVPVGARSRVRARIEAHLDRRAVMHAPSRRRWIIGVALAAPIAAIAILTLWPRTEARAISVAGGDRYEMQLASGQVSIHGPAEVAVSRDQLSLVQGTVDARGQLRVRGPACDVVVQGSAEVSVKGAQLTVRVFAGSVEIVPPVVSCEVIELSQTPPITASAGRQTTPPALATASPSTETSTPAAETSMPAAPAETPTPAAPADSIVTARDASVATPSAAAPPPVAHPTRAASPPREHPALRTAPTDAPTSIAAPPRAAIEAPVDAPAPTRVDAPAPMRVDAPAATRVDAPAASPVAPPPRVSVDAAPPRAVSNRGPAADPLAAEVAAYRAAVALEATDLDAARLAWQAWRARWSKSPLVQSVDLHLLAVLDRLGRHGEASDLARELVRRYPRSPRRAEVERLIVGPR